MKRYEQIVNYVSSTPWAILPSALLTIRNLIEFKASGGELSAEEVREKIGAASGRPSTPSRGAIAVIPITGALVPHADLMTEISGGMSYDGFLAAFRAAMADDAISTIVLDIDSPGGSVDLLAETAREIRAARDTKHIVAVANTMAASAAYYLMAQASEAVVTPSGTVGSIGTISIHTDDTVLLEKMGITETVVTYGEHKAEFFGPLSDDARAELQKTVDSFGREFVADVAKGRGVDTSAVENTFGQGRMLRGPEALSVGMVDRIQSLDDTLARLAGRRVSTARTRAEAEEQVVAALAEVGAPAGTEAVFSGDVTVSDTGPRIDVEISADIESAAVARAVTARQQRARSGIAAGSGAPRIGAGSSVTPSATTRKEGSTMETEETTVVHAEQPMTREGIAARMDAIKAEQEDLDRTWAGRLMTGQDLATFEALDEEWALLEKTDLQLQVREQKLAAKAGRSSVNGDGAVRPVESAGPAWDGRSNVQTRRRLPANVFDLTAYRGEAQSLDDLAGLWKQGALLVNDGLPYLTEDQDTVRNRVALLLEHADDTEGKPSESLAHRILVTGNPEYDRAFGQLVMGRPMNEQQKRLVEAAISHTGLSTETPVPVTIDPTVLLTSDGQVNPLRQISRVVQITGNKWRGISSDGATVVYEAELAEVANQTPAFDTPEGTVAKAHGYVEFSIEIDQDWPELRSNLSMMFADAKDAKEAEKFLYGDGTDEPLGLITALTADGTVDVETGTINTLALDDAYALKAGLPSRWKARAAWLAAESFYDAIRGFGDESGNTFWVDLNDGNPPRLLGKPTYEASEIVGTIDDGGDVVAVYGDFSRGFVIVDRVGLNVELVPLVMGATRRPIGARALYAYFRNTSLVHSAKAFRQLVIKAS